MLANTRASKLSPYSAAKFEHFEMRRQERIKVVNDERTKICQYMSALKSGGAMDDAMLSKKTSFAVTMNETKVITATVKFDPNKSSSGSAPDGTGATARALKSKADEVRTSELQSF